MKQLIALLVFSAALWGGAIAAQTPAAPAAGNRILLIGQSSMPVAGGKATLIIGPLRRADGIYTGVYKLKVFPYFMKNESGRLVIHVSDEALAEASQGKVVTVTGTAITNGNSGKTRHVDVTATPEDINHGKLKLWFTAGTKKMMFEPDYHFAGSGTNAVPEQTAATTNP